MTSWLPFSCVPGMAVPGLACPALAGTVTVYTAWTYIGHVPAGYFDYVDPATSEMLEVVPGGRYGMYPVNNRAGLTVPPPDHRWLTAGNQFPDMVVFRPGALAAARAHNAALQAAVKRQGPVPQPHGTPQRARVTEPAEPSEAALALAAARAVNARLQARRRDVGH